MVPGPGGASANQFDASWDRGSPPGFRLGTGRVIKGWDDGIVGMRVGGHRQLTIPVTGAWVPIKPGETLIFVVDLLSVR